MNEHAAQPLFDAQGFQQPLLLGNRKLDIAGYEIGKTAGLGYRIENLVNYFLREAAALAELSCPLACLFL